MKKTVSFLLLVSLLCACGKVNMDIPYQGQTDSGISHGEIVLGSQLDNPYSVPNMKSAFESVYPGRPSSVVSCTDLYVRFLPRDDNDMKLLRDHAMPMIDHPMDYEILREGDYYHDPSLSSNSITWQYAVVPADFKFPEGIRYELLQECFLVDSRPATKADPSVDWDAVEAEAFKLSGNTGMYEQMVATKAGEVQPSGRITIIDDQYNGGQPFGVSGLKVECNVFVKFSSAYTDREGYYRIPKKFTSNPRYRLVFENEKGFSIGFDTILYHGSVSTLGRNSVAGVSVNIDRDSDRALFRRSAANNAAYEYYERCAELGITLPPSGLKLWMFDKMDASSTVMLHHGTVLDKGVDNIYFKIFTWVVHIFGPDITIGSKEAASYADIFTIVVHELAHASHFSRVGVPFWNTFIKYILSSAVKGADTYGDGSLEDSGYCAVGEMWAYYMDSRLYAERYACANPLHGSNYWFHPQILSYLESRGLTVSQIFRAVSSDAVTDINELKNTLIDLYPHKKSTITQVFNRYE